MSQARRSAPTVACLIGIAALCGACSVALWIWGGQRSGDLTVERAAEILTSPDYDLTDKRNALGVIAFKAIRGAELLGSLVDDPEVGDHAHAYITQIRRAIE